MTAAASLARVQSATVVGVGAEPVEIEIDLAGGLAQTVIVGLPDKAVRESRDRVRAALHHSGFSYPASGRLTLNLAPATVRKYGPMYDLPIAVGILAATGQLDPSVLAGTCLIGELALDGRLRPIQGVLPIAADCARRGLRRLVVPRANGREAAIPAGVEVVAVDGLLELVEVLAGRRAVSPPAGRPVSLNEAPEADFEDVVGQPQAKYAIQVAAAGGHHLMMVGPPGVGKSMLARRLPGILGRLEEPAALETTQIYSVAGLLEGGELIERPPFRSPHHTISDVGLVGGGHPIRPGEVSLAHNGVLFLDEAPEFRRSALDALRQPLEMHEVHVVRINGRCRYPARVQLVLAMNPCPCGQLLSGDGRCRCPRADVERYARRLSGPLLDRIDLQVELAAVPPDALGRGPDPDGTSADLAAGVAIARARQQARYGPTRRNATVGDRQLHETCELTAAARTCLDAGATRSALSARGYVRLLRVARTIADLEHDGPIEPRHVLQAMMLRRA